MTKDQINKSFKICLARIHRALKLPSDSLENIVKKQRIIKRAARGIIYLMDQAPDELVNLLKQNRSAPAIDNLWDDLSNWDNAEILEI